MSYLDYAHNQRSERWPRWPTRLMLTVVE
jgi:hypothetical protein